MTQTIKKNNHLYPAFHIKKWKKYEGKIFDRKTSKTRAIKDTDFAETFYYSNGEPDQVLEERISKFETYIGRIIKKIEETEDSVTLSGKDLELLKLYVVLCANRHHYSIEVIKKDESEIDKRNNYIFGIHTITAQEEALKTVFLIIDDFEKIQKLDNNTFFNVDEGFQIDQNYIKERSSVTTIGLHLAIIRSKEPCLMISDCVAVTENTMDSDYLYTYVPISPTTALLLVKSKYYFNETHFEETKKRFGWEYGCGQPDPYISELFGRYSGENDCENKLFCSYATSKVELNQIEVKIQTIPRLIFCMFNSLYYEDGKKILYIRDDDLQCAKTPLGCRKITVS